jgi:squalene-associated FAD-dependent desaturase
VNADAIVIGGGFAGLSAATALAEQGARVLVLEARPTLGGRATAFTDPATGERVDNGQHVLFGCYHETFRFLTRIGADTHVRLQRRLAIDMIDRAGRRSRLACPVLPSPLHLLAGVMTWDALGWLDRMSILRMRRALSASHGGHRDLPRGGEDADTRGGGERAGMRLGPLRSADQETVRQWLIRHRQTARAIEMLWEPLAVAALNQPIDQAAASSFAAILRPMFSKNPRDAALALPATPLDEMYAHPARSYIERRGGAVQLSSPATIDCGAALEETSVSAPPVIVRGSRFSADTVICAVPWHALSDVLLRPPASLGQVLDAADRTEASPIVTVNLWFDRVVTDRQLIGLPGRTLQWVFDKRAVFGEKASHLSLVSSGAEAVVARSNQELIELAVHEVAEALPAVRSAALLRAVVVREKKASFSVAPGQPRRPPTRTAVTGLLLAGDWIDTGLPATIEGAVVSGHWAAAAALGPAN